jgi:HlyD family secretion protein
MANAGQSRATTVTLWVSGIAAIALIVFAVRYLTRDQVEVRVVPVTYQTLSSVVSTNGKVEPVDFFQAHAPFAGPIKEIFVEVGQHVSAGQLLVRMDDADARGRLASAQAGLENSKLIARDLEAGGSTEDRSRAQSDLASATLDQQRDAADLAAKKMLLQKGAASQAEVDAAQQKLDAANLTLRTAAQHLKTRYDSLDIANAKARVQDSEAAVVSARNNVANVDIRSPIAGTVYNIPFSQYDFVPFGEDILDVADLKRLQVRAYFDEPEIGKLAVGQSVKIEWPAKPNEVWHGHVTIAPTTIFAYNTRSVGICIITIDDPTPDLIPNTNVTVTVTETQRDHVLSIPREALHIDGVNKYVFRIVNGHLVRTPVVTGIISVTQAEIVSGLTDGELVVLGAKSSVADLANGMEVKQVQ